MNNKYIKIWLSVFVFTLMSVGGAASYFAQGRMLYKGTEALENQESGIRYQVSAVQDVAKTSVLHVEEDGEKKQVSSIKYQVSDVKELSAESAAVTSPCSNGEILVIKNGQVAGCKKISAPLAPAPKVKIIQNTNPLPNHQSPISNFQSCEFQGLFTYTGPDRPGLLYGMCLDCPINTFILNGGKC